MSLLFHFIAIFYVSVPAVQLTPSFLPHAQYGVHFHKIDKEILWTNKYWTHLMKIDININIKPNFWQKTCSDILMAAYEPIPPDFFGITKSMFPRLYTERSSITASDQWQYLMELRDSIFCELHHTRSKHHQKMFLAIEYYIKLVHQLLPIRNFTQLHQNFQSTFSKLNFESVSRFSFSPGDGNISSISVQEINPPTTFNESWRKMEGYFGHFFPSQVYPYESFMAHYMIEHLETVQRFGNQYSFYLTEVYNYWRDLLQIFQDVYVGKLSPRLISPRALQNLLIRVESSLAHSSVYQIRYKELTFYYDTNDIEYYFYDNQLVFIINIPLTLRFQPFSIFQVICFPLPLFDTFSVVQLPNVYFVLATDSRCYLMNKNSGGRLQRSSDFNFIKDSQDLSCLRAWFYKDFNLVRTFCYLQIFAVLFRDSYTFLVTEDVVICISRQLTNAER